MSKGSSAKKKSSPASKTEDPCRSLPQIPRTPQCSTSSDGAVSGENDQAEAVGQRRGTLRDSFWRWRQNWCPRLMLQAELCPRRPNGQDDYVMMAWKH